MNTPLPDEKRKAIIDDVITYTETPRLDANEFTVRQYADRAHISMKLARNHLLQQADAGVLRKRRVVHQSSSCWAFSKAEA